MNKIVDAIYSILSSFRKNPFNEDFDGSVIRELISEFVSKNEVINFVFPAFHGKIDNPDFVCSNSVDMGDAIGLMNLKNMIQKIGEVYEPGCVVNIVHEAHYYIGRSPLIGAASEVDQYLKDFRELAKSEPRIKSYSIYELLPLGDNLSDKLAYFANHYEPTAWEISQLLRNDTYLNLYKAYKKVNSDHSKRDPNFKTLGDKERKKRIRQLAILQMQIYFGFGKLVKEYFSKNKYIRLSSLYKSPAFKDCS